MSAPKKEKGKGLDDIWGILLFVALLYYGDKYGPALLAHFSEPPLPTIATCKAVLEAATFTAGK